MLRGNVDTDPNVLKKNAVRSRKIKKEEEALWRMS